MCNVNALICNGIGHLGEEPVPEESLTDEDRKERRVFQQLLQTIPRLQERLMESEQADLLVIAELIQKGVSSARSDDTKSLKGAVLDWIFPRDGDMRNVLPMDPPPQPLSRNVKMNRGFHHPITGELLCPAGLDYKDADVRKKLANGDIGVSGDQWPLLLYEDQRYDPDEPWDGLFRCKLLVSAYKYIFTSPSSVEKEVKATRSGNARLHGMTRVTTASLAYVATQLRFALSSSSVFCRTDTATDSERFYNTVSDFLDDPDEEPNVNELLDWWNCQIFPGYVTRVSAISKTSALAKLKEKRAALKLRNAVVVA